MGCKMGASSCEIQLEKTGGNWRPGHHWIPLQFRHFPYPPLGGRNWRSGDNAKTKAHSLNWRLETGEAPPARRWLNIPSPSGGICAEPHCPGPTGG